MNLEALVTDLQAAEGWVGHLYDDANGKQIGPGSTVTGHPTIAWGFALDTAPLTQTEAMPILESRAAAVWTQLQAKLPWVVTAPENIQRALCNMAYNLGVAGLLTFNQFLALVQQGNYTAASADLETTLWFKQVGKRGPAIQALLLGA